MTAAAVRMTGKWYRLTRVHGILHYGETPRQLRCLGLLEELQNFPDDAFAATSEQLLGKRRWAADARALFAAINCA